MSQSMKTMNETNATGINLALNDREPKLGKISEDQSMIPESENENDNDKSSIANKDDIINIEVNNKKGSKGKKKIGNFKIKKIKRKTAHNEIK